VWHPSRRPWSRLPGAVLIKVRTLDQPEMFGGARVAIYTRDKERFHLLIDGLQAFEGLPA
jgi:hypothetical protein